MKPLFFTTIVRFLSRSSAGKKPYKKAAQDPPAYRNISRNQKTVGA
jgi:hypothetical protein